MENKKTTLEVIAPTVEEAIEKGLNELGLNLEDVDVEVLDEGKRNLFRFATRQSRIRLRVKGSQPAQESQAPQAEVPYEDDFEDMEDEVEDLPSPSKTASAATESVELSEEELVVRQVLEELLAQMGIDADLSVSTVNNEPYESKSIRANIEGSDLSFLIGRKSEILNALQYMVSLIVSKKLNRWVSLQVDVQGFRARREAELQRLARRMADQVVASGRKQYLEPMPANERRIVHVTLRADDRVETNSIGDEPHRKVTICLAR